MLQAVLGVRVRVRVRFRSRLEMLTSQVCSVRVRVREVTLSPSLEL
jgi:hypothetical protein